MSRTPHAASDVDPDYVLLMIRFHIAVFHHNSDECDVDACDYCSWDNYDTYCLLVHFVETLDDWMIADGRAPQVWRRPVRRGIAAIRRASVAVLRAIAPCSRRRAHTPVQHVSENGHG